MAKFQSARQIIGFPKTGGTSPASAVTRLVSICKADYWLPQAPGLRPRCHCRPHVSICKADYWLPQAEQCQQERSAIRCFNLQGRLLASPSLTRGQLVSHEESFNLQGRLLASPSDGYLGRLRRRAHVSICKADYWLPQAHFCAPHWNALKPT